MSGLHHAQAHTRHSPPLVRKVALKPTRTIPSSKSAGTPRITIKGSKASKPAKEEEEEVFDFDDDDMSTTFLQYCAMCEKQILVPNSSILYCSENCRQRDSAPPTPTTFLSLASPKMILSSYNADIDDPSGARIPTYVPRMQPTPRTFTNDRIPPKFHEGTSDLDPTEWKPAEAPSSERQSPGREWKPKLLHRPSSEAFAYLSKFHRSSDSLTSKRRPLLGHSRTMSRTAPSLTHTPTASTSSESSLAGTPDESLASSLTLTSTTQVSDGGFSLKEGGDGADLTYEKKFVPASLGSATGSLKRLLATTAAGM